MNSLPEIIYWLISVRKKIIVKVVIWEHFHRKLVVKNARHEIILEIVPSKRVVPLLSWLSHRELKR
jgi:hypothetical protein